MMLFPAYFGRVRGKHRGNECLAQQRCDAITADAPALERLDRGRERVWGVAVCYGAVADQAAGTLGGVVPVAAVLSEIGEKRKAGEAADEPQRVRQTEFLEPLSQPLLSILPAEAADGDRSLTDRLHAREQALAFLSANDVAEQAPE